MNSIRKFIDILRESEIESSYFSPEEAMNNPNFKRWFSNSKIIDEGFPQIVYHGRKKSWEVMPTGKAENLRAWLASNGYSKDGTFKKDMEFTERLGDVVWFTDDEGIARDYSDGHDNILEAYLRIINPLDLRVDVIGKDKLEEILGIMYGSTTSIDTTYSLRLGSARSIVYDNSIVVNWARNNGYDGIIHDDTDIRGRYTHTSYIVFSPNQIKSCENSGNFSTSNNIHN